MSTDIEMCVICVCLQFELQKFITNNIDMVIRVCVPPPTDDLLQISASQAARMIRDKEVKKLTILIGD